jgi:capsid protein
MRIGNIFKGLFTSEADSTDVIPVAAKQELPRVEAYTGGTFYVHSFTGEKNAGEMGPPREYRLDYESLRARSWQMYLDSDMCQLLFQKMDLWMIGSGLKLQCEPQTDVLESEGITLQAEKFNDAAESRFETFCNSKIGDYSGMQSIHDLASIANISSLVGGDVLVILRLINNQVKVQLIDGAHVCTPTGLKFTPDGFITSSGNLVKNGIEQDRTGKHIAYYVRVGILRHERIPAYGERTGRLMAFMVSSPLKYRIDNNRSLPLISAIMETASKMDRYKEATLGSAEELAKIPLTVEHSAISTGENPFLENLVKASGGNSGAVQTYDGEVLANKVAATTNKQVVNLPQGATLKSVESKKELYFEPFLNTNIMLVCATVGIPKDVALSLYNSNYSASRAAIKDWEHILKVRRKKFADQFYKRIFDFWLDVEVLKNKIDAPGYISAVVQRNEMAVEAYRYCRWSGANVPHIDPLKEVQAERAKLGSAAEHLPLTTLEAATESLGGGSSWSNMEQFSKEIVESTNLNIPKPQLTRSRRVEFGDGTEEDNAD